MKLTEEQKIIINTDNDIKIIATAGSGKTTTMVHYADTRPEGSKILYIVFNKSAKDEAKVKFGETSVDIHTAHSLAYKHIMRNSKYKLVNGYTPRDLIKLLNMKKKSDLNLSTHVLKYLDYYCSSKCHTVEDLNYLEYIDTEHQKYVTKHYAEIQEHVKSFYSLMKSAKIFVTHDFYLKEFQISGIEMDYDYLLFDEGQDASPVMLDVFLNQSGTKIIVGDTHQQIYAWRHAINALECVDYPEYTLSKSFRFGKEIADLSNRLIDRNSTAKAPVTGIADYNDDEIRSHSTLGRTNVGLLKAMIEYIKERPNDTIYFEGYSSSLLKTDEGITIYDILNLKNNKTQKVKHPFFNTIKSYAELKEYLKIISNNSLTVLVTLVDKYENNVFGLIKDLEKCKTDDKESADMVFSTVHKAKGQEYDKVTILSDFKRYDQSRINMTEEINILYVAITRTKKVLQFEKNFKFYFDFGYEDWTC